MKMDFENDGLALQVVRAPSLEVLKCNGYPSVKGVAEGPPAVSYRLGSRCPLGAIPDRTQIGNQEHPETR